MVSEKRIREDTFYQREPSTSVLLVNYKSLIADKWELWELCIYIGSIWARRFTDQVVLGKRSVINWLCVIAMLLVNMYV